jgi:hypothetical protein
MRTEAMHAGICRQDCCSVQEHGELPVQVDLHIPELTVRETFDFAARVQGGGIKAGARTACNLPRSFRAACMHDALPRQRLRTCCMHLLLLSMANSWHTAPACDAFCNSHHVMVTACDTFYNSPSVMVVRRLCESAHACAAFLA